MKCHRTLGSLVASLMILSSADAMAAPVEHGAMVTPRAMLSKHDEAAVREVVAKFCDSWNKHDMAAMHALDTPDVEWLNVVGNDWRGLEEVHRGHANFHRVLAAENTCAVESVAVRAVKPDVAIAVIDFRFGGKAPDGKKGDTLTRSSMVMLKGDGVWMIFHMQNTVINPGMQGPLDPLNFDEKTGLPKGAK
jgi:uncharacterized protein (TIGR02246 family)